MINYSRWQPLLLELELRSFSIQNGYSERVQKSTCSSWLYGFFQTVVLAFVDNHNKFIVHSNIYDNNNQKYMI